MDYEADNDIFGQTVLNHEIFGMSLDIQAIVSRHVETVVLLSRSGVTGHLPE